MAYVAIDPKGLKDTTSIYALLRDRGPDIQRAVNKAAEHGFELSRKTIEREIRYPAGYLVSDKRLRLRKSYNPGDSAIISARKTPTSLARFIKGNPGYGQRGGLGVQVLRKGGHSHLDKAFLMRTKAGKTGGGNVGVMMRVEAYDKLNARRLAKGVDLARDHKSGYFESAGAFSNNYEWNGLKPLYSVSVDQALATWRPEITKETQEVLGKTVAQMIGD